MAISLAHSFLAQNVRPDELGSALVALLLYLSARRQTQTDASESAWPEFVLGLLLGAMLALRFPLAVFGLVPQYVLWLQRRPASLAALRAFLLDRRVWALALAVPLAYAPCIPHTLLHPNGLRAGLQVQWAYLSGVFKDAIGRGPGLYQYGVLMLAEALGWPPYVLALVAVIAAAWRRRPADLLLLATLLPYLLLTADAMRMLVVFVVGAAENGSQLRLPPRRRCENAVPSRCPEKQRAPLRWPRALARIFPRASFDVGDYRP
jgi:hypothetical protein